MHLTNLGFLNPQGHSMSFDAAANGYGRGEGCGIVILKLLDQAIRDGDNIRAVIKGSGVNSDGWTQGVTMPSLNAQAALIKQVYGINGLDYSSVQYVEAHGTGTKVGDPIEASAIFQTIGQDASSSRKRLYMGSLKPNIGHLEAAAGVASVIKGVLSLEHRLIPPTINFTNPNPAIPFDDWNITIPTKPTPWPIAKTQRMSINGFGMGGTNGHIVLDGYAVPRASSNGRASAETVKTRLFVLSSHDRTMIDLQGQLASLAKADHGFRASSITPRIGFVFTGQDALKEMVAPSETNGEKAVDMLIEIGPHSALGGPVEQILAYHGIEGVQYVSMLVRNHSAVNTALGLAASLFQQGVLMDMSKVNGDDGCRLLTDLPTYPWNHSKSFNVIGRAQREQYHRAHGAKSLLGAMMPTMDERERVWRSFIRTEDEPWLRDHVAGSTVLFPAAGMISIAIEAAQQVLEHGKTPMALRLRDISFLTAVVLTDDVATELTVHLRPHLLATAGISPAQWWEFTISSCIGDEGQVRTNCRGLLNIAYNEDQSLQLAHENHLLEIAQIEDFRTILEQCPDICSREQFYDNWLKSSMSYGPAFQGARNVRPGVDQSCYEVEVVDIGETFTKGRSEAPFLISPATLDAAWQGILSSRCEGTATADFGFNNLLLPTFIGEMNVAFNMPFDVGCVMPASCRSHRSSFNEVSSQINMFDTELCKVLLSVVDFRMSQVETDDAEIVADSDVNQVDIAEITSQVRWDYALDLLEPSEFSRAVSDTFGDATRDALSRIQIHQSPDLNVVEVVQNRQQIPDTIMRELPGGSILPTRVRYAVIDGSESLKDDEKAASEPVVPLRAREGPDGPSTDLYIIDHHAVSQSLLPLDEALQLLLARCQPSAGASLGMTADSTARNLITARGITVVQATPLNDEGLVLFLGKFPDGRHGANGTLSRSQPRAITIIEPAPSNQEVRTHSQRLQTCLADQGYNVTVISDVKHVDPSRDRCCISLLELAEPMLANISETEFQSLRKLWVGCERLLWITCGADPLMGLVDGLSRCVNVEIGGTRFQVLHLSHEGAECAPDLVARIWSAAGSSLGNEFRERNRLIQVPRMYQNLAEDEFLRQHLEDAIRSVDASISPAGFSLTVGKPGLLDSLHFVGNTEASVLGDYDLEVDVVHTALNLRDVMASMGLIPTKALGQEASGTVVRVGRLAAASFDPGDRVSTLSIGGTHATRTKCDSRVTVKIPDAMPFAEAAAAPMVFTAAYHALVNIARLRHGQSVLIHAAAGGLGQAAVQLATNLGLAIFVTVGSEEKRKFLMEQFSLPEERIFHSRDASFAKGIQRMTNGRGVDCVLNTLSGELLRVSCTCLATFGVFIEFGLRDITDNMRLDLRPFGKSITFTSLDMPTLIAQDPQIVGEALREVFILLRDAAFCVPQPLNIYPANKIEQAFRTMQQGKHRGKIVLSFEPKDKANLAVLCKASDAFALDPNATYLFVGGLGGLGRSLALEFVACGARHIAFLSRSGNAKPESNAIINQLAVLGVDVKVFTGDVADQSSFLSAMRLCSSCMPPIKGVMQLAMVLRDVLIENMSYDEWSTPLRPKVKGTQHLHEYFSHDRPLDFMIFCSSFSGLCGSPGQAQYGAGNTYQDALAHHRHSQGLKATSVDLGIMLSVGILAEMGTHTFKQWEAVLGIRQHAFHGLIKSIVRRQQRNMDVPAQICLGLGTADMMLTHNLPNPPWYTDPRFKPLTVKSLPATTDDAISPHVADVASLTMKLADAGKKKDLDGATSIATEALVAKIADILRIPTSEIDADRPLYLYGVDSLVALEVRNWITREMKANMALLDILAAVPIKDFAMQIARKSKLVVAA
ncbi:hypothetical protein N0V86_001843 [Didymella sp. IMI 355093]|nr:hypothetical protein N0V86_001843 [Didymella sp. IMI 355093]